MGQNSGITRAEDGRPRGVGEIPTCSTILGRSSKGHLPRKWEMLVEMASPEPAEPAGSPPRQTISSTTMRGWRFRGCQVAAPANLLPT